MFGFSVLTIVKVVGALLLVAALVYGWHVFTESYREQGRAELRPQLEASQAAERQREQETAVCVAASKVQSQAVLDADARAKAAQAESARVIAEARARAQQSAALVGKLQAHAGAAPRAQSCEATLKAADAIVDESLRARRK